MEDYIDFKICPRVKSPPSMRHSQVEQFDYASLSLAVFTNDRIVREGGAENSCYDGLA